VPFINTGYCQADRHRHPRTTSYCFCNGNPRQRLLEDQVPAELIQQGRVDEVLASVNQLLDGVHL